MPNQRMLLIFNPTSGQQDFALNLFEVVDHFTKHGYEVTTYPTQSAGDAHRVTLERAQEFDCLVCSGGDGTLHETVNALMRCKKRPVFGYIPAGTTNDFAASLGLPHDILDAARVITDGVPRELDIGQFGDRYFSYIAAFGLFTDVSYATPQTKKNIWGHMAYLLEGVKRLGSIQTFHCSLDFGDEVLTGEYIFGMISNSLSIGGFKLPDHRNVKMDDGIFEIALLQMPTSFLDLQHIIGRLINPNTAADSLIIRRTNQVTVTSEQPMSWTLDGEFGGELTETSIVNCHRAISIMMPST